MSWKVYILKDIGAPDVWDYENPIGELNDASVASLYLSTMANPQWRIRQNIYDPTTLIVESTATDIAVMQLIKDKE